MRRRIAWGSTAMLAVVVWLGTVLPAWANSPDFSQYPGLRESYDRKMAIAFYSVIGCMALIVILGILIVVLVIRWIVRRRSKPAAVESGDALAAPGTPVPDASDTLVAPEDPAALD